MSPNKKLGVAAVIAVIVAAVALIVLNQQKNKTRDSLVSSSELGAADPGRSPGLGEVSPVGKSSVGERIDVGTSASLETEKVPTVKARAVRGSTRRGSLDVTLGHVMANTAQERDFTEVLVQVGYRFDQGTALKVAQSAEKLYLISGPGESEFPLNDTIVYVDTPVSSDVLGGQVSMEAGTTVPISDSSRRADHITRTHVGARGVFPLFTSALNLILNPQGSYYFNRYTTDRDGNPLARVGLGALAELAWQVTPRVSAHVWARPTTQFYEEFNGSATSPAPSQEMFFGSYLGYRINSNISTQLGYLKGNSILRDMRHETNFRDPITDRFYAALKINL